MKARLTSFFSRWELGLNFNAAYGAEIRSKMISVHLNINEFNTFIGRNAGNNIKEGMRKTKKETRLTHN